MTIDDCQRRPLARLALLAQAAACAEPAGVPGEVATLSSAVGDVTWSLHPDLGSVVEVAWSQPSGAAARVEYAVDGEWRATPETRAGEQVLLGIPYETDVPFRVVVEGLEPSPEYVATTGPLPFEGALPELVMADPSGWEEGADWVLTSINSTAPGWAAGIYWMLVLDRQGRLVWAWKAPDRHLCLSPRVALDGRTLLWDENTFWTDWDGGEGSVVHRMGLGGAISDTTPTPGLNHEFTELEDGTLGWWAMDSALPTGGALRERSPGGEERTVWDCDAFHEAEGSNGACMSNTAAWSPDRGSYLVSFAMENVVVEVDRASGATLRVFGAHPDGWGFSPNGSAFHVQHAPSYTEGGSLLLSTHVDEDSNVVMAREYALDEDTATLVEFWSYGAEAAVEAPLGGDIRRLPGGNTLHAYGTTPIIKEIAPDGTVVWAVAWTIDRMIGSARVIDDLYALEF